MNESEIREEENLLVNKDCDYLYPNLNDPNFIIKITKKKNLMILNIMEKFMMLKPMIGYVVLNLN